MNALDIYSSLRSARLTLRRCELDAQRLCPGSPALASLTIARVQVEAAEEIVSESLCPVCDREGHAEAQCPEIDHGEPEARDCDTIEESLGTWGAGGR